MEDIYAGALALLREGDAQGSSLLRLEAYCAREELGRSWAPVGACGRSGAPLEGWRQGVLAG